MLRMKQIMRAMQIMQIMQMKRIGRRFSFVLPISLMSMFINMQNATASTVELAPKDGQKLILVGFDGNVVLTGASLPTLKIQFDALAENEFQIEELNDDIRISRKMSSLKPEEKKVKPKIEIGGRTMPVEIHLHEGSITASKWQKDLFLHLQKGRMILKENQALVVAHMQKGEISILDHRGKVIIDNLQAQVSLKGLVGDLDLQSYQGDAVLENLKGNLTLHTTNGSSKVIKGSGSLQFETGKGNINSQEFNGRIEGQTNEGSANVNLFLGQDVNIKSQSGKMTVSASPNSGAAVNALTVEGEIYGPAYLKVVRDGSQKILKGRLKGENAESNIHLRSQQGTIIIK